MGHILVVDDDPGVVELLVDVLAAEGHEVTAVTQSLNAFERAVEVRPDLILMDIMMPYLDGFSQVRLFRTHRALRQVPVVVVTGERQAFEALEAMGDPAALGIVDYVRKPFKLADLAATIDRHLPRT